MDKNTQNENNFEYLNHSRIKKNNGIKKNTQRFVQTRIWRELELGFRSKSYKKTKDMQVFLIKDENGLDEYVLIEMQGTLDNGSSTFSDEMMGNLAFRKDDSEALLLIGHHLIDGKITKLEKPFLVTTKEEGKNSLLVKAIIRRRITFKNRPKPIVTKTLVKKSSLL